MVYRTGQLHKRKLCKSLPRTTQLSEQQGKCPPIPPSHTAEGSLDAIASTSWVPRLLFISVVWLGKLLRLFHSDGISLAYSLCLMCFLPRALNEGFSKGEACGFLALSSPIPWMVTCSWQLYTSLIDRTDHSSLAAAPMMYKSWENCSTWTHGVRHQNQEARCQEQGPHARPFSGEAK